MMNRSRTSCITFFFFFLNRLKLIFLEEIGGKLGATGIVGGINVTECTPNENSSWKPGTNHIREYCKEQDNEANCSASSTLLENP